METRIANKYVVCVVNEGGCIDSELGDEYDNVEDAIKAAKKITKKQCRDAGCYNKGGSAGVNVDVYACDEESEIGSNFVNGGMVIFSRWV